MNALTTADWAILIRLRGITHPTNHTYWVFDISNYHKPDEMFHCGCGVNLNAGSFLSVRRRKTALPDSLCPNCAARVTCSQCDRIAGPFATLEVDPDDTSNWTNIMCPRCGEDAYRRTCLAEIKRWERTTVDSLKEVAIREAEANLATAKNSTKLWNVARDRQEEHPVRQRVWDSRYLPSGGGVYVLEVDGIQKIGYATNYSNRLSDAFIPPTARLISGIVGPPKAERELHSCCWHWKIDREWFCLPDRIKSRLAHYHGAAFDDLAQEIRNRFGYSLELAARGVAPLDLEKQCL